MTVWPQSNPRIEFGVQNQRSGSLGSFWVNHDASNVLQYFENDYTISHRKLGEGAFAVVYLAYEKMSAAQLACKVIDIARTAGSTSSQRNMKTDLVTNGSSFGGYCNRQIREAKLLRKIRHVCH